MNTFVNALNMLNNLDWRQPLWLLLALQPILLYLVLRFMQKRRQQGFADAHLLPWLQIKVHKRFWQRLFSRDSAYTLAWMLFAVAMAGPRVPDTSLDKEQSHAPNNALIDIMLVVDLSRSMRAQDIKPSRLRRATLEITELLSMLKKARVGITVYAGRAHLFVPLTSDKKALHFYLQDLDQLQLPTYGSNANAALDRAGKALLSVKKENKQQYIIWLTDGDFDTKALNSTKQSIQTLVKQGIKTSILGLATPEGAAVPLAKGGWLSDKGQGVVSKMSPDLLDELSREGNGQFAPVSDDDADWKKIYQNGILQSHNRSNQTDAQQWKELFYWPLAPAVFLLIVALFPFPVRALFHNRNLINVNSLMLLSLASLLFIALVQPVFAADYKSALNQGIEAYKKADFGASKQQFIDAILTAKNDQARAIALHNLGNALFQSGDYASAANVFDDALRYAPKQQASINNRQLSIELLALLEKRRRQSQRGNFSTPNDNSNLMDLPDQIPFMLNTRAVNLLKVSLPKLPDKTLNKLLARGMQHFKLMEGDAVQLAKQRKQQQDKEQAQIVFMGLEDKTSRLLWKRLFEVEEGFPGKLDSPKPIPGIRPW